MSVYQIDTDDGHTYEIETEDAAPSPGESGMFSKMAGGARQALDIYGKSQFGSPQDLLGRLDSTVRTGFDKAGDFAAEQMGKQGNNPYLAAAVGTVTKMAPDIASLAGPSEETDLGQQTINNVYKKVVPPILKTAKGIPTNVSRMAIDNPRIFELPGTSESIQGRSQDIINAVKEASGRVGSEFSGAYKNAGISNPVDNVIEGQPPQFVGKPFEQLRENFHAAKRGDLFRTRDAVGSMTEKTGTQKLSDLTDLKRGLQDKAIYPAPGQQLAPSQGAHNAAIKQMAAEIDRIRGGLPGGESLALADDAYSEMQAIKHQLISAFKDPGTGRDYLNRIVKGNIDWLTSGRNAAKMGAIQRVEQITGKKVLQPALEEMAASYLKNPDTLGLPSTKMQDILTHFVPTRKLLKPPKMSARGLLGTGNFAVKQVAKPLFGSRQNDNGQGKQVQGPYQQPRQTANNNGNQQRNQNNYNGNLNGQQNQTTSMLKKRVEKVLTDSEAKNYLRKARGDRSVARRMAIADGWTIPE